MPMPVSRFIESREPASWYAAERVPPHHSGDEQAATSGTRRGITSRCRSKRLTGGPGLGFGGRWCWPGAPLTGVKVAARLVGRGAECCVVAESGGHVGVRRSTARIGKRALAGATSRRGAQGRVPTAYQSLERRNDAWKVSPGGMPKLSRIRHPGLIARSSPGPGHPFWEE